MPKRTVRGDEHVRSEEHTSELQSPCNLVCRLLIEKTKIPAGTGSAESCRHRPAAARHCRSPPWRGVVDVRVCLLELSHGFVYCFFDFFFLNHTATTDIYTLSLLESLPI